MFYVPQLALHSLSLQMQFSKTTSHVFSVVSKQDYTDHYPVAIAMLSNRVTEELDNGRRMDVIYLYFAEAFDKVPHQRLLRKLEVYGVLGNCYRG